MDRMEIFWNAYFIVLNINAVSGLCVYFQATRMPFEEIFSGAT